jgi:hypothetical protein
MLGRAKKLCAQRGWNNVTLLRENAAQFTLPEMVDGVLFSLSYSVMPNSRLLLWHKRGSICGLGRGS